MAGRRHGRAARWAAVAVLIAALLALPAVIRVLPVSDAAVPAAELRARALATESLGFSGYAVSAGNLALPVTDQLSSVADLFSNRTTMRVWWRGPADNRVDVVTPAGETDTHRSADGNWTWQYETATAVRTATNPLDLPAAPDVLPSSLGRRLLSESAAGELSRLGARRVAGRDTLGLRLTPAAAAASVRRVDVWIDAGSGLPLQVEVWQKGAGRPRSTRGSSIWTSPSRPRRSPPSARRREPSSGRDARPRWCSRPDGGSGRSGCPTSWSGCPGAR